MKQTILIITAAALVLFNVGPLAFSEEATAQAHLSSIAKDIPDNWWEGGWDKLSELQSFISKYPDKPALCAQAQYRIGNYYQSASNYDAAISAYKKVISAYPSAKAECAQAQYETAQVYFHCLRDFDTAIKEYQKVISDYPLLPNPVAQLMIGKSYIELENFPLAEESLKKVISNYPNAAFQQYEACIELGNLLSKQYTYSPDSKKKISEAISYYKKAYLYEPNNVILIENICDSLAKLDMSSVRTRQFVRYQKYGPAGEDGVLKTKDDLANPLDEF